VEDYKPFPTLWRSGKVCKPFSTLQEADVVYSMGLTLKYRHILFPLLHCAWNVYLDLRASINQTGVLLAMMIALTLVQARKVVVVVVFTTLMPLLDLIWALSC
jgi:hypothetical protein